jgi:hypothetical protein
MAGEEDPQPAPAQPGDDCDPVPGHPVSAGKRSPPPRLLDVLIQRLRYMHYSLRTEQAYVYWV